MSSPCQTNGEKTSVDQYIMLEHTGWVSSGLVFGLILKKGSLHACDREEDLQWDKKEEEVRDMEKRAVRRDEGRAAVRGQNWRDRTFRTYFLSALLS